MCRVLHGDEGRVGVHCWRDGRDLPGIPVHRGRIGVPSGVLTLGDAVGGQAVRARVGAGVHEAVVCLDRPDREQGSIVDGNAYATRYTDADGRVNEIVHYAITWRRGDGRFPIDPECVEGVL